MTKSIKELFDDYKRSPREDWIPNYKVTVEQVEELKGRLPGEISEELLRILWLDKKKKNGIASVGQGFMYQKEFDALEQDLPVLTKNIIDNPTSENFDKTIEWFQDAQKEGKVSRIIWAVISRLFAAANPQEYSTIINKTDLDWLIKTLNSKYSLSISTQGNWAAKNKALMSSLRSQGLEIEDMYLLNTFAWELTKILKTEIELNNIAGIPLNITKENVLQALEEIDSDGVLAGAQSTTYDLMHNEKYYPPKYVLSLANKYANGEILDRNSFEGGEDTPAFSILRNLGFDIERKDFHGYFLKRFIAQADAENDLTYKHYIKIYRDLKVKVSFGQGGLAKIPWISLLGNGQTTSHGIYPVFLYYKALGVLVLAKGISETEKPDVEWINIDSSESVNDHLVRLFNTAPDRYGDSYVYKAYKVNNGVIEGDPATELDKLIDEYNILIDGAEMPEPVTPLADPVEIVSDFTEKLRLSNIDFGSQHENRVRTFVSSLLTKPFVILTGLSGSGKTQIAIRFGEWLGDGRLYVAAVRPDWTGAEALFGYEDALRPAKEGRAAWAVPKPLEFILKADKDPQNPYVLLLDEMNLAHVERYFADVLSGMESGQPCIPNLTRETDGNWRVKPNSPDQIVLPNNVFVIGTVNVDETTYMFSPKVLDRANTFEFRVSTEDLAEHYLKPEACEAGSPELIQGFLEIAKDSDWHNNQAFSESDKLSEELRNMHQILSPYSFEFGHRVYYEAQRFASIYEAAGSATLEDTLDCILIQKILPRLHGSRRRLESLIKGLAHYCYDLSMPSDTTGAADISFDPESNDVADSSLPNSFEKLTRMLRSLRANQFTSFTE